METYVVRIYRLPKRSSRLVLGIVERIGKNGFHRFSDFDELREILVHGKGRRPTVRAEAGCLGVEE